MTLLAPILALLALALGFLSWRRGNTLHLELMRTRTMMFDLNRVVRDLRDEVNQKTLALQVALRYGGGEMRFTPAMIVADAMLMHQQARDVFASFHLGGCESCAIDETQTIALVATTHQINETELLAALNSLLIPEALSTADSPTPTGSGLLSIGMMPEP